MVRWGSWPPLDQCFFSNCSKMVKNWLRRELKNIVFHFLVCAGPLKIHRREKWLHIWVWRVEIRSLIVHFRSFSPYLFISVSYVAFMQSLWPSGAFIICRCIVNIFKNIWSKLLIRFGIVIVFVQPHPVVGQPHPELVHPIRARVQLCSAKENWHAW